jgi:hypothetical protein
MILSEIPGKCLREIKTKNIENILIEAGKDLAKFHSLKFKQGVGWLNKYKPIDSNEISGYYPNI